jgi:ATP-binding cassette subfamily C protein LapB
MTLSELPEHDARIEPTANPDDAPTIHEDLELATLLSRLAALQGEAVGKVPLIMTQSGAQGAEIAAMQRPQRACEIWLAVFPAGKAIKLAEGPDADQMPTLWVSPDESRLLILTGRLTSGAYQALDTQGQPVQLTAEEAQTGVHLWLSVVAETQHLYGKTPKTARDWFRYALLKRKSIFIEAALATAFINILALGSSLYSMNIYDRVVPSKTSSTLWVLSIGVILAYVFDFVIKHVRAKFVETACRGIDNELSSVFFDKMLNIRMDKRPAAVGTFASQIRQFETVRNVLTSTTMFVMADAPFSLLFIAVIAVIAGPIAIIPLLLLPLTIGAAFISKERFSRLARDKVEETNARNGLLVEVISGIESVKAAQGGWKFSRRWEQLNSSLANNDLSTRLHSMTLMSTVQMIQQLLFIAIMVAGVYAIHDGTLTTGSLIACTIIGSRALAPAAALTGIVSQWQGAAAALEVLERIMVLPGDNSGEQRAIIPETCAGHLLLEGITYAYGPNIPVSIELERLAMAPGERVVIMGASGSGKSTLLKVASGLFVPNEGKVSLDGIDMQHLASGFVREQVGYLPQDVWLFEGTLRENITIGLPSPSDAQILRAAELTGLIGVIRSHPMGLALPITEGGRGLSVGQRQLVGLTRLLIAQPRIMLLDEPTAALDNRLENYVVNSITSHIAKDSLFVLVTHKVELLRFATRVIIVDKGKIVVDGPRDQVVEGLKGKLAAQQADASRANEKLAGSQS